MIIATVSEIKKEIKQRSHEEIVELCLQLSKFKKENKELLTYLLYEASDEEAYISGVKSEVEELFMDINADSYYYMKKTIRKILRTIKKYIRYSKNKQTEVELLLHFCTQMTELTPSIKRNSVLHNIYVRQIESVQKKMLALHEDLQYDYEMEISELLENCPLEY